MGTAPSRLPQGADRKLWLAVVDRILRTIADQLYRYRRLSIQKAFPSRHVADEHQAIMSAVLSGGADEAVALLTAHYRQTAEVI